MLRDSYLRHANAIAQWSRQESADPLLGASAPERDGIALPGRADRKRAFPAAAAARAAQCEGTLGERRLRAPQFGALRQTAERDEIDEPATMAEVWQ